MSLTLHEAASEMHPKWQGGLLRPPYKNQFRSHFDPNFSHYLVFSNWIELNGEHDYILWKVDPFLCFFSFDISSWNISLVEQYPYMYVIVGLY